MMDLVTLMESIAEAIRAKTGSTEEINAQDFPQKIREINASLGEDIKYKSVVYNADNTVTLTESDDTVHIMTCEYDGDRIIGFTYDDEEIKLSFDGDKLVKVNNIDIDVDNMPVSTGVKYPALQGLELYYELGETLNTVVGKEVLL